jgi:outer membrane biogenesis lipoprotein LolB
MKDACVTVLKTILVVLALLFLAACQDEEKPRSHDEIIRADLAEILELQGVTCGEVRRFEAEERLDYRAECTSGEVYRIHVSAEGHINLMQHIE